MNEVCRTDTGIVVLCDGQTIKEYQRFRDDRIIIDNNPRSGRLSVVTEDKTNAAIFVILLNKNRQITVR